MAQGLPPPTSSSSTTSGSSTNTVSPSPTPTTNGGGSSTPPPSTSSKPGAAPRSVEIPIVGIVGVVVLGWVAASVWWRSGLVFGFRRKSNNDLFLSYSLPFPPPPPLCVHVHVFKKKKNFLFLLHTCQFEKIMTSPHRLSTISHGGMWTTRQRFKESRR